MSNRLKAALGMGALIAVGVVVAAGVALASSANTAAQTDKIVRACVHPGATTGHPNTRIFSPVGKKTHGCGDGENELDWATGNNTTNVNSVDKGTVNGFFEGTGRADCDSGDHAVGGGLMAGSPGDAPFPGFSQTVRESGPVNAAGNLALAGSDTANGWYASFQGTTFSPSHVIETVYVICAPNS